MSKEFPDGFRAIVMRPIQVHGALDVASLHAIVKNEFDDPTLSERVLRELVQNGHVVEKEGYVQLSKGGEDWLNETLPAVGVEEERSEQHVKDGDADVSTPQRPYDVAKLKMEEKHVSVFQMLRKIEKGEVNLSPDFQRAFVWDIEKQSRLIESILIRIPLPAFYLDASDQTRWAVVDGLQRLTTLSRYCREETFELTGLQFLVELEGCRFSELPARYRVIIEDDTTLLLYNLLPGTPLQAKYTIFSRVNTGGVQLTAQEIRHALSQGRSTSFLHELATSHEFLRATQGVIESKRMADRELALRAIAFVLSGTGGYKQHNELDAFLLSTMGLLNELPEERLSELRDDFLSSLDKVFATFGKYSFRKFWELGGRRGPINKALFEVWVVSVRKYTRSKLVEHAELLMRGFTDLLERDERFLKAISASTGSPSAVEYRFKAISALLARTVN